MLSTKSKTRVQSPPDTAVDHAWPILVTLLPAFGPLAFGKQEVWGDMVWLVVLGFYLFQIVKAPWELYNLTRAKRYACELPDRYQGAFTSKSARSGDKDKGKAREQEHGKNYRKSPTMEDSNDEFLGGNEELEEEVMEENEPIEGEYEDEETEEDRELRHRMAAQLLAQERCCLILVLASPFVAGWTLRWGRSFLSSTRYLSDLDVRLFVFATAIRPFIHVLKLWQGKAQRPPLTRPPRMNKGGATDREVEALKGHVKELESFMVKLQGACATKGDIQELRGGVEPAIHTLERRVHRFTRNESATGLSQRFSRLEARLHEHELMLRDAGTSWSGWLVGWIFLPLTVMMRVVRVLIGGRSGWTLVGEERVRKSRPPALQF
ncbi:uncharacterized protein VTP21DRAFT_5026 [Calcarisporiella thermophila]|uniref:uncharacterized protein n=1 Tax=Calcarisporiella thermophila TaxID=911321 RepID=UPI0037445F98